MELRPVRPDDLATLVTIEQACFAPQEQIAPARLAQLVQESPETCLVVEAATAVVAFLLALPTAGRTVDDQDFISSRPHLGQDGRLALLSLAVLPTFQGQGLATLLLAAMKEVAVQQQRQGLCLTCHESLLGFYEANGFEDQGISASRFGGQTWYDMTWSCPATCVD